MRELVLDAYATASSDWSSRRWPWTAASPRPPAEGRRRAGARWTGANGASSARRPWTRTGHPGWHRHGARQPPRLAAFGRDTRRGVRDAGRAAQEAGEHPPGPRLRLEGHPRKVRSARIARRDPQEGRTGTAGFHEPVGRGAHQLLLAQRPQEAGVVYREARAGDRLLGGFLGRDRHSEEADPGSLESLPLGGPTSSQTVTYCRKL